MTIRLCNNKNGPPVVEIEDSKILSSLQKKINDHWPIVKNSENFPGPQPISLEMKDTPKLLQYDYKVCEKTDGVRFLLYGTNFYNTNRIFLVDRSFKFYQVDNLEFKEHFYKETIFDGELICNNDNQWIYYCHDCICLAGVNVARSQLDIRLEFINKCLNELFIKSDTFQIRLKPFWSFLNFQDYLKYHNTSNHKVDGVIFTPVKLPVSTGTQHTLFKWKENHTFDLLVKWVDLNEHRRRYDLFVMDKSKLLKYVSINNRTSKGKKFHNDFINISPSKNNVVIECYYKEERYIPFLIRDDKTFPNSIKTVEKTHLNIQEDIKLEFFINMLK